MPQAPPTWRPPGQRTVRQRKAEHDRRRRRSKPWRKWYTLAAWLKRRAAQLISEPYCRRCSKRGALVPATVANHVVPHRGNWDKFIGGELESLCKPCHDGEVQSEERTAQKA